MFYFQVPEAFQNLIDKVEETMKFSIEVEEKVPLDQVTNFNEVRFVLQSLFSTLILTHNRS